MMRRIAFLSTLGLVWLVFQACPQSLPPPNDGGMTVGGGAGGGDSQFFTYVDLDTHAVNTPYIAVATDIVHDRIAVAYYIDTKVVVPTAVQIDAGLHDGTDNWEIHYLEWQGGQISNQAMLKVVQRPVGIAVAFQPNGDPAVAYLGGDGNDGMSMSHYWFQSDPELQVRSGGTWSIIPPNIKMSADLTTGDTQALDVVDGCSSAPDLVGFVVGLWPAIQYDSTGRLYWAFRDVHSGQFPQQDWGASDLKVLSGTTLPPSSPEWCVKAGGDDKGSWAGHNIMAIGPNDLPAIVMDTEPLGPDNDGQSLFFTKLESAGGNWSNVYQITTATDVQTGAGFGYDPMEGYGIAWIDHSTQSQLFYTHSTTGDPGSWQTATPIFGSGTGGWFPSLAMDPMHHEPAISFYICSDASGKSEGSCTGDDELDIIQRVSGNWRTITVDTFGQVAALDNPNRVISRIGFFSTGKRFVVYRPPQGDILRLAVEK